MSLLEALLLDSYRMNVWIAYRTDGVAGSGTQSDPFDGCTQAKFDGLMNAMPMLVLSITNSGTTATVTALGHPYANGNVVLIDGATGTDATHYNGPFTISSVTSSTFQYTTANGAPSGPAAGIITHQFIHTIGALPCCQTGGCWRSRVLPLGDGDEKDCPENLCLHVVGKLPKCMDMISAEEVIRRIELYFIGGSIDYLEPKFKSIPKRVRDGIVSC